MVEPRAPYGGAQGTHGEAQGSPWVAFRFRWLKASLYVFLWKLWLIPKINSHVLGKRVPVLRYRAGPGRFVLAFVWQECYYLWLTVQKDILGSQNDISGSQNCVLGGENAVLGGQNAVLGGQDAVLGGQDVMLGNV